MSKKKDATTKPAPASTKSRAVAKQPAAPKKAAAKKAPAKKIASPKPAAQKTTVKKAVSKTRAKKAETIIIAPAVSALTPTQPLEITPVVPTIPLPVEEGASNTSIVTPPLDFEEPTTAVVSELKTVKVTFKGSIRNVKNVESGTKLKVVLKNLGKPADEFQFREDGTGKTVSIDRVLSKDIVILAVPNASGS